MCPGGEMVVPVVKCVPVVKWWPRCEIVDLSL